MAESKTTNSEEVKGVAGLLVYRVYEDSQIKYLMVKPSKAWKDWSPPKGAFKFTVLKLISNVLKFLLKRN